MRSRPRRLGLALLLALVVTSGAGCSRAMRDEKLAPGWTHAKALAVVKLAIDNAHERSGGEALHPQAKVEAEDAALLAQCDVRRDSIGYPVPGTSFVLPFFQCARGRVREGLISIVTGGFAIGLVVDLLVFFPFGYSHRGVFVETPAPGLDEGGMGFYAARPDRKVVYFDLDDRWLWRTNRMDEIAEAFEFLVREAKQGKRGGGAAPAAAPAQGE